MTFKERYQKWKAGELVYSAGKILPHFEEGEDVKSKSKSNIDVGDLFSVSTPILSFEVKAPEETPLLFESKPLLQIPTYKPINGNKQPWVEGYKSTVKQEDSALSTLLKYFEGPVAKARALLMFNGNELKANEWIDRAKQITKYGIEIPSGESYVTPDSNRTIHFSDQKQPFLLGRKDPSKSHEWAHLLYKGDYDSGLDDFLKLDNKYRQFIKTGQQNANWFTGYRKLYNLNDPDKIYNIDVTRKHDSSQIEQIPYIYEAREDMRKAGIWDYTTGLPLTLDAWNKYKLLNPKSRLGNFQTDEDAIWGLNHFAYNPKQNVDNLFYGARGKDLKIPNYRTGKLSYTPSNTVRSHINKWESTDMKDQNAKFGGDAVTAKAKEFAKIIDQYDIEDSLKDALFSTYYNVSPKSFNNWFSKEILAYSNNKSYENLTALRNKMLNRSSYMADSLQRKYGRGIKRRARADVSLFDNVYNNKSPFSYNPIEDQTTLPNDAIQAPVRPILNLEKVHNTSPYLTGELMPKQRDLQEIFNESIRSKNVTNSLLLTMFNPMLYIFPYQTQLNQPQ